MRPSRRRARQMIMRGRVVAVVAVVGGLALSGAVFGVHRALFGPCEEGSADPELSLNPQYWAIHRDVTRIRLCIDGGRCQTKPVPTWQSVYPASAAPAYGRAPPHSRGQG